MPDHCDNIETKILVKLGKKSLSIPTHESVRFLQLETRLEIRARIEGFVRLLSGLTSDIKRQNTRYDFAGISLPSARQLKSFYQKEFNRNPHVILEIRDALEDLLDALNEAPEPDSVGDESEKVIKARKIEEYQRRAKHGLPLFEEASNEIMAQVESGAMEFPGTSKMNKASAIAESNKIIKDIRRKVPRKGNRIDRQTIIKHIESEIQVWEQSRSIFSQKFVDDLIWYLRAEIENLRKELVPEEKTAHKKKPPAPIKSRKKKSARRSKKAPDRVISRPKTKKPAANKRQKPPILEISDNPHQKANTIITEILKEAIRDTEVGRLSNHITALRFKIIEIERQRKGENNPAIIRGLAQMEKIFRDHITYCEKELEKKPSP